MNIKKYRPVLELISSCLLLYVAIKLVFLFYLTKEFTFPTELICGTLMGFSLLIIGILIRVRAKNIDIVGNTFLLLTCAKMCLSYGIFHLTFDQQQENYKFQKYTYFIAFSAFLAIETIITIRMLNKKD